MSTVHVVPVNDLAEHDDSADCICGPRVEFVEAEESDEENGWLVIHHSLDGREADE